MSELDAFMTMGEIAHGLQKRAFSATEVAKLYLQRIGKANDRLHAYVSVQEDSVMAQAKAADARRAQGLLLSPLDGVPFAAKDLCELSGHVTTVGSQAWTERRSQTTCTALLRSLQAGMVLLGKTHMVEFALGGWGANPVMGTPVNPWDLITHRVPGGSSSGSGVAVAAGLAPAAIGSDTGGSVRIPAGLNGLTGLKTTRGLISLHGAFALSSTLDTIGPMVRDAQDAGLWTAIMAGPDIKDPSSLHRPRFEWASVLDNPASQSLRGVKLALLPPEQYPLSVDPEALAALDRVCDVLRAQGAVIEMLPLPFDLHDLMQRNGQIIAAEAYAIHHSYIEDMTLPIGEHVRARVLAGKGVSALDYIDAIAHHRACSQTFDQCLDGFAGLLTPTLPYPAVPLTAVDESQTPMAAFCRAGNYLTGCAVALPAGLSGEGLPLSVQLIGKAFSEADVLRIALSIQSDTDWHRLRPDLSALDL